MLHKKTKEVRGKELVTRDKIVHLKQEMEEARERKKVGIAEREQLAKGQCSTPASSVCVCVLGFCQL